MVSFKNYNRFNASVHFSKLTSNQTTVLA